MKISEWIVVSLETSTMILPLILSPFVKVFLLLMASYSIEKFVTVIFLREKLKLPVKHTRNSSLVNHEEFLFAVLCRASKSCSTCFSCPRQQIGNELAHNETWGEKKKKTRGSPTNSSLKYEQQQLKLS